MQRCKTKLIQSSLKFGPVLSPNLDEDQKKALHPRLESIFVPEFSSSPESKSCPAPKGGISGPCPSNHCLCPAKQKMCPPKRELCPKEINRYGATGVQFGLRHPQILIINPVFVGKNPFFADFAMKTFFFVLCSRIRGEMFCARSKFIFAPPPPPSHAILEPGLVKVDTFSLPRPMGGLFSLLVQKSVAKVLKTWYFAKSA